MRWKLYGDFHRVAETGDSYVWVPREATVRDALEALVEKHPELDDLVYEAGDVRDDVHVVHNHREVWEKHGLDTPVEPGDELALFSTVGEG